MLPAAAVSAGVFPGLAWSAYKLAGPAVGSWAANSRIMHHPRAGPLSMRSTTAMVHTASMPEADSAKHPSASPDAAATDTITTTSAAAASKHQPIAPHPGMSKSSVAAWAGAAGVPVDVSAVMQNPVYTKEYMESIKPLHITPKELHQRLAFATITAVRKTFDLATGYHLDRMNEAKWLRRIIFLETVAGVPGMVSCWLNITQVFGQSLLESRCIAAVTGH